MVLIDKAELHRRVAVLGVVLLAMCVAIAVNAWYTNRVARQSEHKLCDVLTAQVDAYRAFPPATETGRRIAREIAALHERYEC